ncbi:MAG: phosphoadenosine phosphosulfate reductase [Aurantimonas endophytica]
MPADQILVVHADLGRDEWPGNVEHIRETVGDSPMIVCRNENKDFLSMTEKGGMFPPLKNRQCTSELKRGPIQREIRRYLASNPRFGGRVVDCIGLRAQESAGRAKKLPLVCAGPDDQRSAAGRQWWTWLPIHDLSFEEVWSTIADASQQRHYGYELVTALMLLLLMANQSDLTTAAKAMPELHRGWVETRGGTPVSVPSRAPQQRLPHVASGLQRQERRRRQEERPLPRRNGGHRLDLGRLRAQAVRRPGMGLVPLP